jgi:AbiU2
LILSLSRLTDPAEGRDSNLSLEQLIAKLDSNSHRDLIKKLKPLFKELRQMTVNIRKHRHKRIAHNDFATTVGQGVLLPLVSRKMIEEALIQIESYLNTFNYYFTNSTLMHDALTLHMGTDILFSKLMKAKAYELLEKEGTIPHGFWRKDKLLSRFL